MNRIIDCHTRINSNREYHADVDILSSSMLKNALESPATYIQCLLERFKGTRSTDFGSLMHALVLEPCTANELVAIYPSDMTRVKHCSSFKEINKGRLCLSLKEFIHAENLADKVLNEKFRGRKFHEYVSEGIVEQSIYYTDPITGMRCRTRPDLNHPEFTFDLKTTRYWSHEAFDRQAIDLHYDLSAYMYTLSRCLLDANGSSLSTPLTPKPFVLLSVCTESPHSVFFRPTTSNFIDNGKKKYENAMAIIKACTQVQTWPAMGGEKEIDLSPWQIFSPSLNSSLTAAIS